jgi:Membrane bound beta barrel domain (DUF5777)
MKPASYTWARVLPAVLFAAVAGSALAQDPTPAPTPSPATRDVTEADPAEPDFKLLTLPTTLEMPLHKAAFRVTHRFTRPLGQGDFGDLAGDFFGFDSSAQIGLELRFGLLTGTQIGIYRTSDKTIEFFAQQLLWRQDTHPLSIALDASFEGRDNLHEDYSPRVALLLSHKFGDRAALYVEPAWIGNTFLGIDPNVDDNSVLLGIGGRLRIGKDMYLVGEISPRLAGYKPRRGDGTTSAALTSFAFEKVVGGHAFQINFSNAFGTTPAQVARAQDGGVDDWYIGFNIARKFF